MLSKTTSQSSLGKRICLLFCFSFFALHFAFGQGGTWTWISGSNQINSTGVFGTQGVPSVNNHPAGEYEPSEWKDKQGNFWIYGGTSTESSDLWKYNPVTKEWTWVKGDGQPEDVPVYGTHGVPNSSNTPGTRAYCAATWVDTSGFLWLFGGVTNNYPFGENDLWRYNISTNEWTWMKGGNSSGEPGVHGTQGIPSSSNTPGSRNETCSAWTDSLNNLWLFGGTGYDDNNNYGLLNDLCKYNITTNEWTWMKGSAFSNAPANYGTKGIANATNDPGGRYSYTKWKDAQGNFWLMGGSHDYSGCFNDLWKYDVTSNNWIWMSGTSVSINAGAYHATCLFDTVNLPYSRSEQRSSVTDNCGRFWLLGGSAFDSGYYALNDVWVFDPQQLKWNWLRGANLFNQTGSYGTLGVPSPSNIPPARMGAVAWWGNDNKVYMFGGWGINNYYADLWVFNPDTACVSFSCNSVSIPPPVANFQSNKRSICENDCINFTDLSTNATSWQWHFAGALDSTSTAQNPQDVCYLTAGIYNVTLIASNSGGSDTLIINDYITVSVAPATPNILDHPGIANDTLFFSTQPGYISWQWYLDTALIPNATDTFLIISKSGNYNVAVTNASGCKISVGINIILGLQNYMTDYAVSLWPNPVKDKFTVYGLRFTVAQVEIYNVLGQVVQRSPLFWRGAGGEADVSTLPSGIYFVQLVGEKERWIGRFVKE